MASMVSLSSSIQTRIDHVILLFDRQLLKAIARFPLDIVHIIKDPLEAIDIQVTQCDISFAKFRIRDSELLKRGGDMLQRRYEAACQARPQDSGWDMFINSVFSVCV